MGKSNIPPQPFPYGLRHHIDNLLRRWQALLPHATAHEVEGASHFLHDDAPDEVVASTLAFLRRVA